jgi:phage replication-related protein YjqB (UPF0714/DUF867 family)
MRELGHVPTRAMRTIIPSNLELGSLHLLNIAVHGYDDGESTEYITGGIN